MDSLFTTIEENQKGMGSISIFQDGKEIYNRSYGYSDVEGEIKIIPLTKFRIGSISKTFTATVIMKLIEEGKLSLTSTLSEYYPQIPNADKIAIVHLLQHRSGIVNFTNAPDYPQWNVDKQTKEQLISRIVSGGTTFQPDEKFEYSNSNYVLLTYIAEDVSGKTFSGLLNQYIIQPCHLKNTYPGGTINPQNKEAYSYTKLSREWEKASETDMSIPLGAGYMVSNSNDLNQFLNCLFTGKIVNKESLDKMLTLKDNFGLGLIQVPFHEKIGYGHTGGIDGFQSITFYIPDSKLSVTILENGIVYPLNNIVIGCLSIYFGKDYQLPIFTDPITLASDELDKYLGVYASSQLPIKLTITKKENTLIAQGTGQPEFPLEYMKTNTFQFESAGVILEFIPEENKMILKQFGQVFDMSKE